jgi:LysR family glycine cleavage system transcriptional activator
MVQGDDDLARLEWVMSRNQLIHDTGYEDLWKKLAQKAGLSFTAPAGINIDTTISALELAAAGIGPAIVLERLAQSYLESGRLVRFVDMALPIAEGHYVVQPESQKRPKPEATLFRDWILEQAARDG